MKWLTSSSRSCGGSSKAEPASLGGCDINTIGEGGDNKAGAIAEVLVAVWERCVADANPAIFDALVPVRAQLTNPLEALDVIVPSLHNLQHRFQRFSCGLLCYSGVHQVEIRENPV